MAEEPAVTPQQWDSLVTSLCRALSYVQRGTKVGNAEGFGGNTERSHTSEAGCHGDRLV